MILRVAGINHADPLGRKRIERWLSELRAVHGQPKFIAVEWDAALFAAVRSQREGKFRQLISTARPHISGSLLSDLISALGYEGDAHTKIFPQVETVWLDQGRQPEGDEVENFSGYRFDLYEPYLRNEPLDVSDEAFLAKLSRGMAELTGPLEPYPENDRDRDFATVIQTAANRGGSDWAIAIVGRNHTQKQHGRMCGRLENLGIDCEVSFL